MLKSAVHYFREKGWKWSEVNRRKFKIIYPLYFYHFYLFRQWKARVINDWFREDINNFLQGFRLVFSGCTWLQDRSGKTFYITVKEWECVLLLLLLFLSPRAMMAIYSILMVLKWPWETSKTFLYFSSYIYIVFSFPWFVFCFLDWHFLFLFSFFELSLNWHSHIHIHIRIYIHICTYTFGGSGD